MSISTMIISYKIKTPKVNIVIHKVN